MPTTPRLDTALTAEQTNVLNRYARGADIAGIVAATGMKQDRVSDILIRLCSLNRNAARELVRFAPRAPQPGRPLPAATRGRKQRAVKAPVNLAAERNASCPNADQHTPHPRGHVQHSDWAEEMTKTHEQRRCNGCGLWAIWVPRQPVADAAPDAPAAPSTQPDAPTRSAPEPDAATDGAPASECVDAPTLVDASHLLARPMRAFEVLAQYPAWHCPTCRFTGAIPGLHTSCAGQLRRASVVVITGEQV